MDARVSRLFYCYQYCCCFLSPITFFFLSWYSKDYDAIKTTFANDYIAKKIVLEAYTEVNTVVE